MHKIGNFVPHYALNMFLENCEIKYIIGVPNTTVNVLLEYLNKMTV